MNSKILLVEGIPGSGKTTLINALLKKHFSENERKGTLIHLSQLHTYKPLVSDEDDFYADKTGTLHHLSKVMELIVWSTSVADNSSKLFILIDTLHFTHCFRPGSVSWTDVASYDKHLAGMKCKLIFLKATPATIFERAILKRNAADELYLKRYQKRYGATLEEVHQYYMTEQEKMEQLLTRSSLTKMTLPSEKRIAENKEIAYDFWSD